MKPKKFKEANALYGGKNLTTKKSDIIIKKK